MPNLMIRRSRSRSRARTPACEGTGVEIYKPLESLHSRSRINTQSKQKEHPFDERRSLGVNITNQARRNIPTPTSMHNLVLGKSKQNVANDTSTLTPNTPASAPAPASRRFQDPRLARKAQPQMQPTTAERPAPVRHNLKRAASQPEVERPQQQVPLKLPRTETITRMPQKLPRTEAAPMRATQSKSKSCNANVPLPDPVKQWFQSQERLAKRIPIHFKSLHKRAKAVEEIVDMFSGFIKHLE